MRDLIEQFDKWDENQHRSKKNAVQKRIKETLDIIKQYHPDLAQHLIESHVGSSAKEENHFGYYPDEKIAWETTTPKDR